MIFKFWLWLGVDSNIIGKNKNKKMKNDLWNCKVVMLEFGVNWLSNLKVNSHGVNLLMWVMMLFYVIIIKDVSWYEVYK